MYTYKIQYTCLCNIYRGKNIYPFRHSKGTLENTNTNTNVTKTINGSTDLEIKAQGMWARTPGVLHGLSTCLKIRYKNENFIDYVS